MASITENQVTANTATIGELVYFTFTATAGENVRQQCFVTSLTTTLTVTDASQTESTLSITLAQIPFQPSATVVVPLKSVSAMSSGMLLQSVEVRSPDEMASIDTVTASPASTTGATVEVVTTSPTDTTNRFSTPTPTATDPANATIGEASSTSSIAVASRSHDGLQAGAVAGVAIGCAAAGALIAFLLAFFCFRKRRRDSGPRGSNSQQSYYDDNASKAPLVAAVPVSQSSRTNSGLDSMLPVPVHGRQIGDQFAALGAAIAKHVESFYANGAVTAASYTNSLTPLLGSRSPHAQDQLHDMLSRPGDRIGAIRFLIAWSILRNIEPDAPPETTLLPPDLAESMAYMSASRSDRSAPDHALLLAKWRQLSGELLKARYGDGGIARNDSREQNMGELASMLNTALEPYASDRSDAGRLNALVDLIKSGARFGYMLFTQPTSWRFAWDQMSGSSHSEMVVFPRLVQVRDERGMLHEREQYYGIAQTVPLGR